MAERKHCETCRADRGFCIYCQRQFTDNGRLHRHIQTVHQNTLRARHCEESK